MKLTVTISLVQALPRQYKQYKWSAIRPDESMYAGSSEPHFGAAIKAQQDAERAFKNPAIMWDKESDSPAMEEVGKPVHYGCVFVSEEEATQS